MPRRRHADHHHARWREPRGGHPLRGHRASGLPAEMERIFEPFFTTKAPGKGTGPGAGHLQGHHREVQRADRGRERARGRGRSSPSRMPLQQLQPDGATVAAGPTAGRACTRSRSDDRGQRTHPDRRRRHDHRRVAGRVPAPGGLRGRRGERASPRPSPPWNASRTTWSSPTSTCPRPTASSCCGSSSSATRRSWSIIITGYGTIESAVEAIKMGAYDYLTKPIIDDEIRLVVERALQQQSLIRENQSPAPAARPALRPRQHRRPRLQDAQGLRPDRGGGRLADHRAHHRARAGTGKSLIARAIHHRSRPARQAVRRGQLRGPARDAAGERAVRPRQGRVHRGDRRQGGQVQGRRRRHDLPGRDLLGHARPCRSSCCACSRSGSSSRSAATRPSTVDVRVILATNEDLPRRGRRPDDSARTSTTASTW